MDTARSGSPTCSRTGVDRGSRGVDVVDDADVGRHARAGIDAASNVPSPLVERQPALPRKRPASHQTVPHGQAPEQRKLRGKRPRRDVAAAPRPLGIARDRDEALGRRRRNRVGDEQCNLVRESAPPALLPRPDERTCSAVVDDRRPRIDEGKPSSSALGAASDGPVPRRSAALAHGRNEPCQRGATGRADRVARQVADGAALGQDDVEHAHAVDGRRPIVTRPCRDGDEFAGLSTRSVGHPARRAIGEMSDAIRGLRDPLPGR